MLLSTVNTKTFSRYRFSIVSQSVSDTPGVSLAETLRTPGVSEGTDKTDNWQTII